MIHHVSSTCSKVLCRRNCDRADRTVLRGLFWRSRSVSLSLYTRLFIHPSGGELPMYIIAQLMAVINSPIPYMSTLLSVPTSAWALTPLSSILSISPKTKCTFGYLAGVASHEVNLCIKNSRKKQVQLLGYIEKSRFVY
jgi:hypothetical protein